MSLEDLALLQLYKGKPKKDKAELLKLLLKETPYEIYPDIHTFTSELQRKHDNYAEFEKIINMDPDIGLYLDIDIVYLRIDDIYVRFYRYKIPSVDVVKRCSVFEIVPELMSLDVLLDRLKQKLYPDDYTKLHTFLMKSKWIL